MLLKCKLTKPMTRNDSGEGNGTPLQYPYLKNPMDRGTWWAAVHGVAKSWTWLSDFTFTFHFHALKKETATHSSVLAWRIAGTGEPGGLPSMGSHRVGHDWSDLAAAGMTLVRGHAGSILWRSPYHVDEQCLKCWGLFRGSKEGRWSRRGRCPSGQEGARQPRVREQSLVQVGHISWAKGVVKDKGAHRLGKTVNSHEL